MRKRFSDLVSGQLKRKRLSLTQLAAKLNVTPEYVGMILAGKRDLKLDRVPQLAAALGLHPYELTRLALQEQFPVAAAVLLGRGRRRRTKAPDEEAVHPTLAALAVIDPPIRRALERLIAELAARRAKR